MAPREDLSLVKAALELGAKDGRHGPIEDRIEKVWDTLNRPHQLIEPYEAILRSMLQKTQGDKPEAEALRRYPTVWRILCLIFRKLPLVILARYLTEGNFHPTLVQTIKDVASTTNATDGDLSEGGKQLGKRKRRSDSPFDLDLLRTPALSLVSAQAFLAALNALFDRIRDPSRYRETREQKSVNFIRAMFATSVQQMCNDQIVPLFQIFHGAYARPAGAVFEGEEGWVSTALSLWHLRQSAGYAQSDAQVAATSISSLAFSLYKSLVSDRGLRPQAVRESWKQDLKDFSVQALFVPSRDEYAYAQTTDIVKTILDQRTSDSSLRPLVLDLLFEAARSRAVNGKISRDDYSWIRASFSTVENSLRLLNKSVRATVVMEMLTPRDIGSFDEALGPTILQDIYNKYILEQKETRWELVDRVLRLPDVFLGGEPSRKVLDDVFYRIQKASSSEVSEANNSIRSILSTVGNGFADAGNLHEFLTKWVGYLSKAENKRVEGSSKSRSIWFSVPELVQARFKTKRQLELFLDWFEAQDVPPGALLVVLAAVAKDIQTRYCRADMEFAQAVGTKLCNIMAARILPEQEFPADIEVCRWDILQGTVSWTSHEDLEDDDDGNESLDGNQEFDSAEHHQTEDSNIIWASISKKMVDILHTGDLSSVVTFGAVRTCATWANLKTHGVSDRAMDEFCRFLSRVARELSDSKKFKWKADQRSKLVHQKHWTKSEHRDVFPGYYLHSLFFNSSGDGSECADALYEFSRLRPLEFRDFMNSISASLSRHSVEALESVFQALATCKRHLENRIIRGWLVSELIEILNDRGWNDENEISSMSIKCLTAISDYLPNEEYGEKVMRSWKAFRKATWTEDSTLPTQREGAKELSTRGWRNCVALLGTVMEQPVFYEGIHFEDLVDIADSISQTIPTDESEISIKLALAKDVKRLASCVIGQMASSSCDPESRYFSEAMELLVEFSNDEKGEYPLRIILLGEIIQALQAPGKAKDPAFLSVRNRASEVLGKIVSNGLELLSKAPKKASGCEKRWFEDSEHSVKEMEQLRLYLLPLSLSLDYLPTLQRTKANAVHLDVFDLNNAADKIIAFQLDVGFGLKRYLLQHQRDQLNELSALSYDIILGLNTDVATASPLVEAFIDGLSNQERMKFLYHLIFSYIDPTRYQPMAFSALGYVITHVENEGIVPAGWDKPFDFNEAHIQMCQLLALAQPLATMLKLSSVVHKSLARESGGGLLQEAIEETLSALCRISCPEAYRAVPFSTLCDVVEICLKAHRVKMAQRLHLLMETLCRMLTLLINGEYLAIQTGKLMASEEKVLRAMQFVSLVRRVCEPTSGAVGTGARLRAKAAVKEGGSGGTKFVDDTTVEAYRDDAGATIFVVLIKYVDLVLQDGRPAGASLSPETEEILRPGLCRIFDVVKDSTRDFLGGSLGPNEWTLIKEMYGEYKRARRALGH